MLMLPKERAIKETNSKGIVMPVLGPDRAGQLFNIKKQKTSDFIFYSEQMAYIYLAAIQ